MHLNLQTLTTCTTLQSQVKSTSQRNQDRGGYVHQYNKSNILLRQMIIMWSVSPCLYFSSPSSSLRLHLHLHLHHSLIIQPSPGYSIYAHAPFCLDRSIFIKHTIHKPSNLLGLALWLAILAVLIFPIATESGVSRILAHLILTLAYVSQAFQNIHRSLPCQCPRRPHTRARQPRPQQ